MSFSSVFFNRYSGNIHFWEYNDAGVKKHFQEPAPLYFFMKTDEDASVYKSIYGDKLKKVEFDSWNKFKEAKDMYKAAERQLFESDVDVEHRFILDRYSSKDIKQPVFDIHYIDIEVHSEKGFPKATLAEHPITVITVYSTKYKKLFIFAEKDFNRDFLPKDSVVKICPTEEELIKTFIAFVRKTHPDIISGWNSNGFDMPYIINRSYKLLGEEITNKLSPVNHIQKSFKKLRYGKKDERYEIAGISCIDYLDLYRKYHQGEQESFKLNYIAKVEIGEEKIKYEGSLKDLYHNDWQTYMEYNVQDVMLLKRIDDRIAFMNMMIGICYNCRVPFEKFEKTTKVLDGAFISRLSLEKIILPDVLHEETDEEQYAGAYVKPPIVGLYDWVVSFDATSLYPSIMIQHNISPETKVMVVNESIVPTIMDMLEGKQVDLLLTKNLATEEKTVDDIVQEIQEKKYTIASNGAIYRHDTPGVVAVFVKEWFDKRKHHKKLMESAIAEKNDNETQLQNGLQQNYKILINSVYGYVGSKYARLYDRDNAVAVTATGQEVIKTAMDSIDNYFATWADTDLGKKLKAKNVSNVIVAGDTDSLYGCAGKILESFNYPHINDMEKGSEFLETKIEPLLFKLINGATENLTNKRQNCSSCRIGFKREMIARRAIFFAKKRYMAWVRKMETKTIKDGDHKEIKAVGIEMIKSSTPEIVRDFMRDYNLSFLKNVNLTMSNDQIRVIYDKFRSSSLDKIAKISNVNNIEKYTGPDGLPTTGTPYHVKGAIGYNMMIDSLGLEDKYEKIFEGDKVKVLSVKKTQSYPYDWICFKEELPKEFGMNSLVDYDIMWGKVFVEPIRALYDVMKWSLPNFQQEDISDLFA